MQVDPIKPKLKLPGAKRLKLQRDEPLSNFAFNFNLRRYTVAHIVLPTYALEHKVRRCSLTVSKPELKARLVSEYSLEIKM